MSLQTEYLPEPEEQRIGASSFNPQEYIQLLARRWPIILVFCALGLAAGALQFYLTPPMYRSQTTLQIERRSLLAVAETNPYLEAWTGMKYYPTQYRLLESRGLAERVVLDLELTEDPRFNPTAGQPETPQEAVDPAANERLVARLASRIQANLNVRPIASTELVRVSYEGRDPELVAEIVNGVTASYIDWGIETRSEDVSKATTFLDQQIAAFKDEIGVKEKQLQQYGRDIDIVNLDPESNEIVERIGQLNRSYTQAIANRVEIEARSYELAGDSASLVAEANPTPLIDTNRRNLLKLEREYETKLSVYKPDHPVMDDLESKIAEARLVLSEVIADEVDSIRRQANAALQTARRRERSLKDQFESARREAMALNSVSVELRNLEMEIGTRRELLDQLLRRQSETGMSARLQTSRESNIRVIDKALVPTAPFRPAMRSNLTTGASGGLVLGLALVFVLHLLDRTVKSAEELEQLLGLPVLAVIADLDSSSANNRGYYARAKRKRRRTKEEIADDAKHIELIPQTNPRLGVSEAYRSLRTALLLSTAGGISVITVTSAEAGEGKTATAANLATVMAQLGRKTLIVDADLRKARLHRVLGVSNRVGLVNVLAEGLELDSALQSTAVENLTVLPSGPYPPNPSELLASEPMADLVLHVRRLFDIVIIDSPPVLAVTDAILAGKLSDGVLVCLRAARVRREDAQACCDQLYMANVRILGTLLNCYKPGTTGRYDRRYSYHYAYEGYADEDGEVTAGGTAA